jgi:hypothetical protein
MLDVSPLAAGSTGDQRDGALRDEIRARTSSAAAPLCPHHTVERAVHGMDWAVTSHTFRKSATTSWHDAGGLRTHHLARARHAGIAGSIYLGEGACPEMFAASIVA